MSVRWALAVVVLALSLDTSSAEASKEGWYVRRGHENMEIGNLRAAIEAFESAVAINPHNREASKALGTAYEKSGLIDKAIAQFDRYLDQFPGDADVAFAQAQRLTWSRYSYRRKDAIRYFELGLSVRDEPKHRHALAKLLGQKKETASRAVTHYETLIEQDYELEVTRREYRKLVRWNEADLGKAVAAQRQQVVATQSFADRHELAKLLQRQQSRPEAVALYQELVLEAPQDATVRHEYARLLAADRQIEAALRQYETLLKQRQTYSIRAERADLLAATPETRQLAAREYSALLKERPADVRVRLRYAAILGSERASVAQAISQYRQVLRYQPQSAAAHRGLARGYAWTDDQDQALHYGRLATQGHDKGDPEFDAFVANLARGRETSAGADSGIVIQPGAFELNGLWLGAAAALEPNPFLTLRLRGGLETYWRDGEEASGAYVGGSGRYRMPGSRQFIAALAYHSVSAEGLPLAAELAYQFARGGWRWQPGFLRRLRDDSFVALVGSDAAGTLVGAVRDNVVYVDLERQWAQTTMTLRPYVGMVSSVGESPNEMLGGRLRADYRFADDSRLQIAAAGVVELSHYETDHSALSTSLAEPRSGGYFSPQLFFNAAPQLHMTYAEQRAFHVRLQVGPGLQYYTDATRAAWQVGFTGHLTGHMYLREALYIGGTLELQRMADVYTRYKLGVLVRLLL